MSEEQAHFAIKIDADSEATKESAEALERFRAVIAKSQQGVRDYRKSLLLLKGSSDEVETAKDRLRAAIAAEEGVITKNNLAILKLGGSYDKLQKAHVKSVEAAKASAVAQKKLADSTARASLANKSESDTLGSVKKAIAAAGGPLKGVADKFSTLKEIAKGVTSGWGLLAVAGVGVVAALAALTVGAVALIAKFTEWTVVSGDALRNMRLVREAASGGEKNATAWGYAIDWLSLKVATSKDALNELAVATERSLRGTRVSGQGMVDTFNAVAQSASAMGDQAGKKIEDLLTRGKQSGRFGINFTAPGISELQGTGVTFKQVAQQLAKNLNVGLGQAQRALLTHTVTIDAGAKALRQVIETQLGGINAKKMLSLDSLFTKFKDNVRDWAQDIAGANGALEPLLGSLKKLVDLFGLQSESGQKMKAVVTQYATALAGVIDRNLPTMKALVEAGLSFAATLARIASGVIAFSSSSTGLFMIKSMFMGILAICAPLIIAVTALAAVFVGIPLAIGAAHTALSALGTALGKWLVSVDWKGIGAAIIDGVRDGILGAYGRLEKAVTGVGENIKSAFKNLLGIHSPSRVFADFGRQTAKGYEQGIGAGSGGAQNAVAQMVAVEAPSGAAAGAPGAAASPASIAVQFIIQGGGDARQAVQDLQSGPTLAAVTFALRTALRQAGIPTGAPVMAGG